MLASKVFHALGHTEMSVFAQDRDLRYVWVYNPGKSWLSKAEEGSTDHDLLVKTSAEHAIRSKEEVLQTRKSARLELADSSSSMTRWYDLRVNIDLDEAGEVCGVLGTCVEITDQKRREETLKTLLRELSHRSKNLLAIIQSLASQTARHSVTVPEFLVRFRGRIQSLAYSQDIVTDADWRGADLASLIKMQVERYAPDGTEQISVDAVDVYLSPTASLHVGLALHELAVNAASYGSLSVPGGRVMIKAAVNRDHMEETLVVSWHEWDGPKVRAVRDPRFGTSTLERIVPNAVGGHGQLQYDPTGIRYELVIPETQYELTTPPKA